jgi:hypothetical protein
METTVKDFETLAKFGIFNPEGLHRLAELIRNIQALSAEAPSRETGPDDPPMSGDASPEDAGRQRRKRGRFNLSREELAELRSTMTGRAIARKYGVSLSTVQNHLRRHGLTRGRGGRG